MTPNKAKLFIHIGTHKTGSTTIQSFLRNNRVALEKRGLTCIALHHGFEALSKAETLDPNIVRAFQKNLSRQIAVAGKRHPDTHNYVISWEGFSGNPATGYSNAGVIAEHLKQSVGELDTRIVVYLRRQDAFLESMYTQMIHEGESYTFEAFFENLSAFSFDWKSLLSAYGDHFGNDHLIVREYSKDSLPKHESILVGFFDSVGIDIRDMLASTSPLPVNRGYSRDALEIAKLCNPQLTKSERNRLRHILQTMSARQPFERYAYMSSSMRSQIVDQYASSNASIAATHFKNATIRTTTSEPVNTDEETPYQGLSADAVLPVLTHALQSHGQNKRQALAFFIQDKVEPALAPLQRRFPGLMAAMRRLAQRCGL